LTRNHFILLFLAVATLMVTRGGEFFCTHELLIPRNAQRAFVLAGGREAALSREEITEFITLFNMGEDPVRYPGKPVGTRVVLEMDGGARITVWSHSRERAGVETVSYGNVKRYTVLAPEMAQHIAGLEDPGG
jgi:hypothetical protein